MMSGYIGGANTRVTYIGSDIIASNATTYNSTGITLPDAYPRRWVIVGFSTTALTANLTQPNVTSICGNGSPTLVWTQPVGVATAWSQLWIALVPTNADNTITATRAANMAYGAFSAWAAYDLQSITATDALAGTVGDPSTGTLNVTAGGLAVGYMRTIPARGTITWTGVAPDFQIDGTGTAAGITFVGGSVSKLAGPTLGVTATPAVAGNVQFIGASWR